MPKKKSDCGCDDKKDKKSRLEKVAKKVSKAGKRAGKVAKAVKSDAKSVYKKAKNGRVYKMVNGRPRFVSKKEAEENGFD